VHIEAVLNLAASGKPSGHLDLPGLMIERRGPTLLIGGIGARSKLEVGRSKVDAQSSKFELPLPVPGAVEVPDAGVWIAACIQDGVEQGELVDSGINVAIVQAASVAPPFVVRSRRAGDRMRPLGAPGHRKLQDVLVDRKVPRDERDRVPIVVDSAGRIVWVVGVTIAEECRVTAPATGVVVLKVRRGSMW